MTTSNELLPCPFCGGAAAYQRLRDGSKYGAFECGECGAQGPDVRTGYGPEEEWREKATAAWNERSAAAPPAAAHEDEAMDELRRSVAEILGQDPDTWPSHGNAPLAIASALALATMRSQAGEGGAA